MESQLVTRQQQSQNSKGDLGQDKINTGLQQNVHDGPSHVQACACIHTYTHQKKTNARQNTRIQLQVNIHQKDCAKKSFF